MAEFGEHAARAIEALAWHSKKARIEERFNDLFHALYGLQLSYDYEEHGTNERSLTITWWEYEDEEMNKLLEP